MGLASFVLTAIASRFVYPAVSMEAEAFWIVRAAPVSIRTFLWVKFFLYYVPLVILAEILIVVSNLLLDVTPFMMGLSTVTVFAMVPGVVALAVGLGAAYPDFKSENPAQAVTSFGGLLFMISCAGFIASSSSWKPGRCTRSSWRACGGVRCRFSSGDGSPPPLPLPWSCAFSRSSSPCGWGSGACGISNRHLKMLWEYCRSAVLSVIVRAV
jgi:hypothetical protein